MKAQWMAVLGWLASTDLALSAPPRINTIYSPAVQRGVENALQIVGKELNTSAELLIPFAAEVRVTGGGQEAINVSLKPSLDASPGVYPVRIRTAEGVSNLRLLAVGDLPVVRVQESVGRYKNGSLDLSSAQSIPWPCIIAGHRLERDIDAFRFAVQAGDRLTFVTETWRVGLTPDPLLRLRDGGGRSLAYAHDTRTLQRDERLDFTFQQSGDHYLELQSTGGGGWNNHYLVKVGPLNYARSVFPLGGRRGDTVNFQVMDRDGQTSNISAEVPADPWSDQWRLPLPDHPGSLPWLLAAGEYPELTEQQSGTEPQPMAWPATVNGRLAEPGEQDLYSIAVEPGQQIRVRVEAFHQGSALDGYLLVYDPAGKKLIAKHDDQGYRGNPDPAVDFDVPADVRELVIALRDTLNQGGPLHSYRLTVEEGGPDFFLWLGKKQNPTNEEDLGWHRMDTSDTLNLSPGQESKLRLSVRRTKEDDPHYNGPLRGYTGPITVQALNLPDGVTAQPLTIPDDATEAELVFTVDANAPKQPFEIVVVGEAMRASGASIRRIAERRLYISDPAITNMPWNWRVQKVTCVTTQPAAAATVQP